MIDHGIDLSWTGSPAMIEVEVANECSWHTSGKQWDHGMQCWVLVGTIVCPRSMQDYSDEELVEFADNEERLCIWKPVTEVTA